MVLLDGYGNHLFNYDYISLMKEHGIAVAMLPPHNPYHSNLDDVPFAHLGNAWDSKLQELNQQMGGQKIPKTTICHEFPAVFYKAASEEGVKKGFLNCGL